MFGVPQCYVYCSPVGGAVVFLEEGFATSVELSLFFNGRSLKYRHTLERLGSPLFHLLNKCSLYTRSFVFCGVDKQFKWVRVKQHNDFWII